MLRIAWGTFGIGGAKRGPGASPPAPPRARARPASYARLSLPHNLAVVGAAPGRRAPAANQSRTFNGHEAKARVCPGPALAVSTMRSDVTRSLRATSSLHLPHLVDHLAVSALARRALRSRRPRASPLALFSFPPTHPVHGGAKRGPGPSPPAPPRARARRASYARPLSSPNIAVVRGRAGRRAPAANQSRTFHGHARKQRVPRA